MASVTTSSTASAGSSGGTQDITLKSYLQLIGDPTAAIEKKLKAAQELSENFESVVTSSQYSQIAPELIRVFIKVLEEGEPQFIAEPAAQQLRKLLLEILHRIPTNDHLKLHVKAVLALVFKLLEVDNEENVLICLRLIIELHKVYRPQYSPDQIQKFLNFVKGIYRDLANHTAKIFEPRQSIKVKDIREVPIDSLINEIFVSTPIMTEKRSDNQPVTYNLIPRAKLSLKVLAELPIIVVLMYQLYKQNVHQDVAEFIPLIMNTIVLQPTKEQRVSPSFNKEAFVDFIAAQIKTLSFLAYIIRIYQEAVTTHATQLVKGMLGLLTLCPPEVAHLRKDLLIATRHILATDLRNRFVGHISRLFDEDILIGSGWTAHESMKPLAYSTLADLVHHVRTSLPLSDLALAVDLFSKNIHDDSLLSSIQTMSCKLLLNLVESIRTKSDQDNGNGRELLMHMLDVYVLKFKAIAEQQLPALLAKCKQIGSDGKITERPGAAVASASGSSAETTPPSPNDETKPATNGTSKSVLESVSSSNDKDEKSASFTVSDCRSLVKTLVCGAKTITWGTASCKSPNTETAMVTTKQFHPKETLVFVRLVKYALKALDIYTITVNASGQTCVRPAAVATVKTKEEKEVLEHFAGVFTLMNPLTFKEIFSVTIDYMVERIYNNYALQIVANSFLANVTTSATFATILVEYLLARLEEMGSSSMERSNLYLKLFKLVFGSVSLFANENEQMLKPHLHTIVNRSMELAMTAKEPYNYFLLLRALFRSIGGGSHDLLYQEFLPLLPDLLQGLNSLQSGLHKQHMKDLFVELCLTVPVRLSSLLPYLPMLMDPLVSALNGSQTLISQGLRTLELCVDNLQPDFLYDHIQPVRADLMQALWRCLRNSNDSIAHVAFRVLGKFGGGNRKMLREPQGLTFNQRPLAGPSITVHFQDCKQAIQLPVEKAVECALQSLKATNTDMFYRKHSWQLIKCFLVSAVNLDDDKTTLSHLLMDHNFQDGPIQSLNNHNLYECTDSHIRQVMQKAISAMFVAAAVKELQSGVVQFMASFVRHFTMALVAQQAGPFMLGDKCSKLQGTDAYVLIDALATVMGDEEKELCKPAQIALVLILETATCIMGSKERACQLPLFVYMAEKMCALCYERAWYSKLGGCTAIKFMFERMGRRWILQHQFMFLKALVFVMMDLTSEVSSGALDMAKSNFEQMLRLCASEVDGTDTDLVDVQKKSFHDVSHELVRQVTSPNTLVREQAMHGLRVMAEARNITVTAVMEPHKDVLQDMVPPKKHLLRHQPANAQIGLMDGNTFCTTLEPKLFTIDLEIVEHKVFFTELLSLCEAEDAALLKLPCYKSVKNLVPLRKSGLRALSACHYISTMREKIFNVLYKELNSTNNELQKAAHDCMKKFIGGFQMDMDQVHTAMRALLGMLGDYRNLTLNVIQRLTSLTQLFPNTFNEKLCDQLLTLLKKKIEVAVLAQTNRQSRGASAAGQSNGQVIPMDIKTCAAIINIYHLIPAATSKIIEPLTSTTLRGEKSLYIEAGSPFHEPLFKFLIKFPQATVELFLSDAYLNDPHFTRVFLSELGDQKHGEKFRDILAKQTQKISDLLQSPPKEAAATNAPQGMTSIITNPDLKEEHQYIAIQLIHTIVKYDPSWLTSNEAIVKVLVKIWTTDTFHEKHRKLIANLKTLSGRDSGVQLPWREPKLIMKCLLAYFKQTKDEIELLFQMLRSFSSHLLPQYQFFKDFLTDTVAQNYTIEWKRKAFFKFSELFHDTKYTQEMKAKMLQYILIPCFQNAFDSGKGEDLIGGPAAPDQDNPDNVISVFINKVIDPDNPFGCSDAVRILLLQFSSLLVEQASPHIHDAANKRQGNKLRRLMTFAWPCLLAKSCVDPATKYNGHLLLSHIIAKFAIHKRIVLQVFHSLLKAHAVEARTVVRQALDILTPAMPGRMEDGNGMLIHWTKKIIVEEGHTVAQLTHILQLIVRHNKVYYPVRHQLVQHMVTSMQRLAFTGSASIEHRKLTVDIAEVIIKWEIQRLKGTDEGAESIADVKEEPKVPLTSISTTGTSGSSLKSADNTNKQIEKHYCDAVVNFLLRIACQVNETSATTGSPGELLSKRCVTLLKSALKSAVWPNSELKLNWFEKLFLTVDTAQPNYANICTALELLTYLLTILKKETVLSSLKPLQRGVAACMTCTNTKVIRSVHSLLSKLMSIFPTESASSNVASKYDELEVLYACVSKVVYEGLSSYEKSTTGTHPQLFGTLMILKAACSHNAGYIDRLITSFMRVLQRMAKEHLAPTTPENIPIASELLILSLDLVKNRVGVMNPDMRKSFIGTILVGLIEKTPDAKVMKAITKMVEDWIKTKATITVNQTPHLKEKVILLVKLMQNVEKRFSDELELNAQFLELVNFIYRDKDFIGTELTAKLEVAFLAGLRCSQPAIRQKFFQVFENSIRKRLFDRLMYICSSQNWEAMAGYLWIKQCLELVLSVAVNGTQIQGALPSFQLAPICSVVTLADSHERAAFIQVTKMKEEPMDIESIDREDEEIDIELTSDDPEKDSDTAAGASAAAAAASKQLDADHTKIPKQQTIQQLLARHSKFLDLCQETKTVSFLTAVCQLSHANSDLAAHAWVELFPRIWKVLSDKQQQNLAGELIPFLCSGSHVVQKDVQPSACKIFFEAISRCVPSLPIRPSVIKYIGKSHNLWHRAALILENMAMDSSQSNVLQFKQKFAGTEFDFEPNTPNLAIQQETYDMLSDIYALLREKDMLTGLWTKKAKYPETVTALSYEQHGYYEQAQTTYEQVMAKARGELNVTAAGSNVLCEFKVWEDHWVQCAKELNQWDLLLEYANSKGNTNPHLILESAWRVPNWSMMKDALAQVEASCPKESAWKVSMYRGYIAICHPDEQHLSMVDKLVDMSTTLAIKEWRRLPRVVSHIHTPFLQAAQQIMELQEAAQISHGLQPATVSRNTSNLHDMKAIVKTWKNRLPILSDDLSHWSDVFAWRQHHYQFIINHYDSQNQSNNSMLGVHASAQAMIHYGKIARKHNLTGVCLDSLSRIHTIPSVPILDCYQKIKQQVKCHLLMAGGMGKNELQEGLEVIESTNLKYFTKEMTAEFYALKGMFLAQLGRSDDANKAFSAAVQMHDTLVKAWALWGDYLEQIFTKSPKNISTGVYAITCFLHACRHQNESRSRKYLAKVLWLLTYDDEKLSLAEAVDNYCVGVPPIQWLPWIPQLLTCLVRNEGKLILNLLSQVGRMYPQAVYFPIRTLYLTLKIEQRERYKSGEMSAAVSRSASSDQPSTTTSSSTTTTAPVTATSTPSSAASTTSTTMTTSTENKSTTATTTTTAAGSTSSVAAIRSALSGTDSLGSSSGGQASGLSTSGTTTSTSQSEAGPIRATPPMWRCSRIMHMQRDLHPTILSSLEGIVDQMVWFRETWYEEVLRQLKQGLTKCYVVAFENRAAVSDATITPHTLNFVKKLVSTFGIGIENVSAVSQQFSTAASESLARRAQMTAQDPVFQKMKQQFTKDFDFKVSGATKLHNLIVLLKKWIKLLEAKTKLLPKMSLIEEKCRFLSNFSLQTAEVELPGEFLLPKHSHYYVRIARFMPKVEIVHKLNTAARRLYIRGHNGKVYPYLVVNDANLTEARREERVLQLLRMMNHFLTKQKETSQRLLYFTVPRVVAVAPQMRLVEDNPASTSLLDIFKQRCAKRVIEHDAPITRYYERLAAVQQRGSQASHQVLRDLLKDIMTNQVPRTILKEWAMHTFQDATDYWTFRSNFTVQLALEGLAEYVLHLTRLNPDMMYVHKDSGYISVSYFKFDIDEQSGDLGANRPVPFRLTPNIAEFISQTGVTGPLTAAMVSAARCFVQPRFKLGSLLKAILRDEYITWHKKKQDEANPREAAADMEGLVLIEVVNRAVLSITNRVQDLATFDGAVTKVSKVVPTAHSFDNLCRMDPSWHPWL